MRRDDLYITVPSFFRCPISLDVMKSPVSLCTGVTYDRASIQTWLDSGNNTCPATMQVLHTKEFVPNKTLQRLIEIWSESLLLSNRNEDSDKLNDQLIPSKDDIVLILKRIGENRREMLNEISRIEDFVKESDGNKEFLAKLEGFISMLVGFLGDDVMMTSEIVFAEKAVVILELVAKFGSRNDLSDLVLKRNNPNCLSALIDVIQRGSCVDSRVGSVRILELISNEDAESKVLVSDKEGLLSELVKLLSVETDQKLSEASLSLLSTISVTKRVKSKIINLKVIKALKSLLTAKTNKSVTEKTLKLLETVSSCKEGRVELCRDTECVEAVAGKVLKVSSEATEYGVTILWSVCYLFRDERAQEAVNRCNGLTKILLLMQSNCSPAVRQMAADLLKIFRVNSKSCLSSYDTKTTHIMPF